MGRPPIPRISVSPSCARAPAALRAVARTCLRVVEVPAWPAIRISGNQPKRRLLTCVRHRRNISEKDVSAIPDVFSVKRVYENHDDPHPAKNRVGAIQDREPGWRRRASAEIQYGTQTMVEIMHDVPSTRSVDALRTRFGGGAWRSAAGPSCGVVVAARRFACRVVRRGGDDAIFRWAGG